MSTKRLQGKVAVVTGSGRGIGRAEAMALSEQGASVVISDFGKNESGEFIAEVTAADIKKAGGKAVAATADLMTAEGAERTIQTAVDAFGGLDILVNNAGMRSGNPVNKLTEEQWDLVLGTHLKATFLTTKFAVPFMRARGGGSIVNTGSEAGLGMLFNSAYAAAKEGIAGFTRCIAREQGRFNIRCNMIRPRATAGATGGGDWFTQNLMGPWKPLLEALGEHWIGERGFRWDKTTTPEAVGALVAWLCTPAAENINGQDFFIGGDEVGILNQPDVTETLFSNDQWSVEGLDAYMPTITSRLVNPYGFPNPLKTDD